ncbi:MAG: hypothetical protein J5933_04290, partial [Clostridia bacterium]|nr:hypothetical protein [Clostridia bacterium]
INGVYVYSFLDSDLKGIIEFKNGLRADDRAEVLCYDFQTDFVREHFSNNNIKITNIPMDAVKEILR